MNPLLRALILSLLLPGALAQAAASGAEASAPPDSDAKGSTRLRAEPAPQQQSMLDLAQVLASAPETEVNWLETNSDRSLMLYHPANRPTPLGAVILLPDQHSHPDWPPDLHPLRIGLTAHGWDTLSIALPQTDPPPVPPRSLPPATGADAQPGPGDDTNLVQPAVNANASVSEDTEIPPMELYGERVVKICEAAIRHLASRQRDYLIFLGSGSGATWAALCTREFQATHPLGLVMLNPRQPGTPDAPLLTGLLAELDTATLDLYQNDAASIEAAQLRANSASRAALENYHQRRLPRLLPGDGGDLLLREVRGSIKRYLMPLQSPAPAPAANQMPGG